MNSLKYNNNSAKEKKKRRTSYIRRVNQMWKTEYEKYNYEEKTINKTITKTNTIEFDINPQKVSKDDSESFKYSISADLLENKNSVQVGNNKYLTKSVCSADDIDHKDEIFECTYEKKTRNAESFFRPILEDVEQENDTTQRNTKYPMLLELEREYAAEKINSDQDNKDASYINLNDDNEDSSKESVIKPILK